MIKAQEVAKVNICTQLVDTQQKRVRKGRGAKINITKLGLTLFLTVGNPGPTRIVPKR